MSLPRKNAVEEFDVEDGADHVPVEHDGACKTGNDGIAVTASGHARLITVWLDDSSSAQTYEGGCHCGRVRFRVTADLSRVTYCNCSMCAKKGFLHLIVPPENFELLSGKDALTTYRFNTGAAQHTFCATCGIHPFYVPRSDPDKIDVNVRCLDGVDIAALEVKEFDGRNWEHAMAGRVPWR